MGLMNYLAEVNAWYNLRVTLHTFNTYYYGLRGQNCEVGIRLVAYYTSGQSETAATQSMCPFRPLLTLERRWHRGRDYFFSFSFSSETFFYKILSSGDHAFFSE